MTLTPRPGILEVAPYVGGEASISGVSQVMRLASNENPLGASPRAIGAYSVLKDELHRYPDGGVTQLRAAIAEAEGLDPARIVCGAGSDELIALLVRGYAGPKASSSSSLAGASVGRNLSKVNRWPLSHARIRSKS